MTTTHEPALQPGNIVSYQAPTGTELAIIDELTDTQARILTATGQSIFLPPEDLTLQPVTGESGDLLTRYVHQLKETNWLLETQLDTERGDHNDTRQRTTELTDTIADMRRYAINAHRRSDICRTGLDDFLTAHDLAPYTPRYTAKIEITATVELDTPDIDSANLILRDDLTCDIHTGGHTSALTVHETNRDIYDLEETTD